MATCMISRYPIQTGDVVYGFLLQSASFLNLPSTPSSQCIPIVAARGLYGDGEICLSEREPELTQFLRLFLRSNHVLDIHGKPLDPSGLEMSNMLHRDVLFRKKSIFTKVNADSVDSVFTTAFIRADVLDPLLASIASLPVFQLLGEGLDSIIEQAKQERILLSSPVDSVEQAKCEMSHLAAVREFLDRIYSHVLYGTVWDACLYELIHSPVFFREHMMLLAMTTELLRQLHICWQTPYVCLDEGLLPITDRYLEVLQEVRGRIL